MVNVERGDLHNSMLAFAESIKFILFVTLIEIELRYQDHVATCANLREVLAVSVSVLAAGAEFEFKRTVQHRAAALPEVTNATA